MIKTEFPNTVAAATALTDDEIACAPGPALVAIYNLLTEGEEVKRFAIRADGVKRVTKLVAAAREAMSGYKSSGQVITEGLAVIAKHAAAKVNGHPSAAEIEALRQSTKAATAAKLDRKVPKPAAKPVRVGARTEQLILSGLGVADVVAALKKEFPDKANSEANVRWYRGKLKRERRLA